MFPITVGPRSSIAECAGLVEPHIFNAPPCTLTTHGPAGGPKHLSYSACTS